MSGGRYLAFAWAVGADADREAAAWSDALAAGGWRAAVRRPGLEVWSPSVGGAPVTASAPAGVVVVGAAQGPSAAAAGGTAQAHDDPFAAAAAWARERWGGYVALFQDVEGRAAVGLRDPAGGLDALAWRRGAVGAVADDLRDLPAGLGPAEMSLDWDVIVEIVRNPFSAEHLCPLHGVSVVTAGEAFALAPAPAAPRAIWRPADFLGAMGDDEDAAGRLRACVLETVARLAGSERRILAEVSGGLDSAIVAAALRAAGLETRVAEALNYRADRPESDERSWARAVCDLNGLRLREVVRPGLAYREADFTDLAASARPAFASLDAERDRDTAARAADLGVSAIFSGQGGDAVFYQMPSCAILADYRRARRHARRRDPLTVGLARRFRRSVWSVWAEAAAGARAEAAVAAGYRSLLAPRARVAQPKLQHPWLRDLGDAPPGKRLQVEALVGSHSAWGRSRRGEAARIVLPLLAQPIVELCLGLPSWVLAEDGQERGLARRAFADLLPPQVRGRRSKGALTAANGRRVAASLEVLRPLLLDGVLADAGVLDRAAVDAALQPDRLMTTGEGTRLLRAAMVEGWVRRWQGYLPDLARSPWRR